MNKFTASVGVMAHNEERNIRRFLDSLLKQDDFQKLVYEIIIISSGSTDKTNRICAEYAKKYKKIKFIRQNKRSGKATAVNVFIAHSKKEILILANADLLLEKNTIKKLLRPLRNNAVGITGSHPIPVNKASTMMGYISHLQWRLHHEISLKKPKMGEMIAFRKIFKQIPFTSSVDEANIEPLIRGQGYLSVYVHDAYVFNKGPETISEFLNRRRHIYFGHIVTKNEYSYEVSTLNTILTLTCLFKIATPSLRFILFTSIGIFLEIVARGLGYLDYKLQRKSHTIWKVTPSTKDLSSTGII